MEQQQNAMSNNGQFIYLSRNSKLAGMFQETAAGRAPTAPTAPRRSREVIELNQTAATRAAATACPKLQAVANPSLELTRPLAAALMRDQAGMRCKIRGVLLDNEYVRDICAAGAHQHCPFLKD